MILSAYGGRFHCDNPLEFFLTYWEVFQSHYYTFSSNRKSPFIIDAGSHIGLSVFYFKKLYPSSTILAFEPNPKTFNILKKNVAQNKLKGVKLVNAALSKKKGTIKFYTGRGLFNWSWGDTGEKNKTATIKSYKEIQVRSVRLSDYITKRVDFLKLDVEGMEGEIIHDIRKKLKFVQKLMLEFHRVEDSETNKTSRIISLLQKSGFKVRTEEANLLTIPFGKNKNAGEPYRLLIYAER